MANELLTVSEVALIMKISEGAVVQKFAGMPGVIDLGRSNGRRRRYRILRIPRTVLEKYLSVKAGKLVTVDIPDRAVGHRRRSAFAS